MSDTAAEKIVPALLTIPQVCEYLNVARATFYKLNSTGAYQAGDVQESSVFTH